MTIGYDAPWRVVHDLLIRAVVAVDGIEAEPRPSVYQNVLNHFYVEYQINACTRTPHRMTDLYSLLHASIQDRFNAAGMEIMSPHYASLRDGNTIAIPEKYRAPGYCKSGFSPDPSRDGDSSGLESPARTRFTSH